MPKNSPVYGLPIPVLGDGRPDAEQVFTDYTTRLEAVLGGMEGKFFIKSGTALASTQHLDTLSTGVYSIMTTGVAEAVGAAEAYPGTVVTYRQNASTAIQQYMQLNFSEGVIFQRTQFQSKWGPWQRISSVGLFKRSYLTASTDIDALEPGFYQAVDRVVPEALGLPVAYPGLLSSFPVSSAGGIQTYTELRAGAIPFTRTKVGGKWSPWASQAPSTSSAAGGWEKHQILLQRMTARKGGRIGTGGKGVIALRFDDAPTHFREKALPLLKELNLPFTRISTSESIYDSPIPVEEFTAMQAYCIESGGEVWNHGKDHKDLTEGTARDNLIGALESLRAKMPRIPIDCFAPPGGAVTYAGNMPTDSPEKWDTPVGNLIMTHHAHASGYMTDSYFRVLDGVVRDSTPHYSVDTFTASRIQVLANQVRDWKHGLVLMWHMDKAGSGENGFSSWADFEASLRYIAQLRDQGSILVLTMTGLAVADAASAFRDDLIIGATGSSSSFLQYVNEPGKRQNVLGSTRELTATVTGTPGAKVISRMGNFSVKTHTIPSSGTLQLRHVCTIPLDQTGNFAIRVEAPCSNVKCLAV